MINNRWAWFIMEIPSPLAFGLCFFMFGGNTSSIAYLLWGLWTFHYINRSIIYPIRQRDNKKKMPLAVTFSAIFSKLWRLGKVLQMRRRSVSALQSLGPLLLLLTATIAILIAWTVSDPLTWDRFIVDDDSAITYGRCTCQHWWAFFGPLMSLMAFAEIMMIYFATQNSKAPKVLRESGAVAYTILLHVQSWVVGVPILAVLGESSANATYAGRVALICVFSLSSLLVIVAPKLCRALFPMLGESSDLTSEISMGRRRIFVSGMNEVGRCSSENSAERLPKLHPSVQFKLETTSETSCNIPVFSVENDIPGP